MKTFFKKENLKKTLLTFGFLILGVLFCTLLSKMFNFAEFVLCYLLLLAGIICIVVYSLLPSEDKDLWMLLFGIISTTFGFLMMVWPRFFGVILSAIICYSGVSLIVSGLKQKKKGEQNWITEFVIGIIVTVLSVITAILSGTNTAKNILSIFFGIMLLFDGGLGLAELIVIARNEKKQQKDNKAIEDVLIVVDENIEQKEIDATEEKG